LALIDSADRWRTGSLVAIAYYLTWHLRRAWASLTYTHEQPSNPANPVATARRSEAAQANAFCQHDLAGQPYHSFRGLIEHLATSPTTRSGSPEPAPPCRCSPSPPARSAKPSL